MQNLHHPSNPSAPSDMLKWFLDLGTGGVKALDALADKPGSFATLSTIGGGIAGAKNLG